MKTKWCLFFVIGLLVLLLTLFVGCGQYTKEDVNRASQEGYDTGFTAGLASTPQDVNEGLPVALWDMKVEEAYDRGYGTGYVEGEDKGYNHGKDIGYETGYDNGYRKGRDDGYENGRRLGYELGYQDGFVVGEKEASVAYYTIAEDNYAQGYIEGYQDCIAGKPNLYTTEQEQ